MAEHRLQIKIRDWMDVEHKDVFLRVYRNGKLFGTLKVSQGSVDWSPAGLKREKPHVIYWTEFDEFAKSKRRNVRVLSASAR
jgi:hypothetical protein